VGFILCRKRSFLPNPILAGCRREEATLYMLAWIAKSKLKQGVNFLEILAKQKGGFSTICWNRISI
jgi:hypothetical protein